MNGENFSYEYALVCSDVPKSLVNGLSLEEHEPVELELAREQHKNYLETLKNSGLKLVHIDSNENFPDCVFVEDTCVALHNKLFITNPGALSRRDEVKTVKSKIESISNELKLEIGEVKNKNEAFIDGGDVLYTGMELIVGISSRTNQKGAQELGEFFSNVPLITCEVTEGLHLKSLMSMFSPNVIVISQTKAAKSIRQQIEEKSKFYNQYKFIEVSEDAAANILTFNDRIMTPLSYENVYSNLKEFLDHKNNLKMDNSEFKKIDGCLTCRCVFFNSGLKN